MSAWRADPETLELVSQGEEFLAMIAEAASWAERITLCVTAPHSELGTLPWWRELLARSSKCSGVYVCSGERAERWLLHRLHATGALRLVDAAARPVADSLLMFARADERRALLAHSPLERAVARAGFGALLAFRGEAQGELARACQRQVESWAALARIPSGREIDVMTLDSRRRRLPPPLELPRALRIVTEPSALAAGLERLGSGARESRGLTRASALDQDGFRVVSFPGGYRVGSRIPGEAAFVLTLQQGPAWAGGNALLLDDGAGHSVLVWRGGLLGPSRSRAELVWAEARLRSFLLEDPAHRVLQRVAVVAVSTAALGPQLGTFFRELERLCDVFEVQPSPPLGHLLSDFATLSPKQQALLAWRALIGSGAQGLAAATAMAADALRAQGYFHQSDGDLAPGAPAHEGLARLLDGAVDNGFGFDRPRPDEVRAIQPDAAAYAPDDWLECLLLALPENAVVPYRSGLRLAFEHARQLWGLRAPLRRGGVVERALAGAVASALSRGLLVRVGAGRLERLTSDSVNPDLPSGTLVVDRSEPGFIAGWVNALAALEPVQRWLIARCSGWYGPRVSVASAALVLGLGLERAESLLAEAWRQVGAGSGWGRAARLRLERALAGARSVPVRLLVLDDAWWRGVEDHLELADALFDNVLGAEFHSVVLGSSTREAFFARYDSAELAGALQQLLERAARIETPIDGDVFVHACEAVALELDVGLGEYLRDELETRLERDPADATLVIGFLPEAPTPPDAVAPLESPNIGARASEVPGGPHAIASVLNDVTETLEATRRPLDADRLWAIVQARVEHSWPPDLVFGLIRSDPALALSPAQEALLRRWEPARLQLPGEPLCPGIPAAIRRRLEARLARETPPSPEALGQRLATELQQLERADDGDDARALPLARQLADVAQRLLQHASSLPAPRRALALATIECILDAVAADEQDPEAPLVDLDHLRDARSMLDAVLRELDLIWS